MTVCHWFSYHVLLLPVFKVNYPPPLLFGKFYFIKFTNSHIKTGKRHWTHQTLRLRNTLGPPSGILKNLHCFLLINNQQITINNRAWWGSTMVFQCTSQTWDDSITVLVVVVLDHLLVTLRTLHFKWPRLPCSIRHTCCSRFNFEQYF